MLEIGDHVKIRNAENCLGTVHQIIKDDDGIEKAVILIPRSAFVHRFEIPISMLEKASPIDKYTQAISNILATDGLEAANTANHKALETNKITLEQFQAAARVLAREILNR